MQDPIKIKLEYNSSYLIYFITPWDTEIFGYKVVNIDSWETKTTDELDHLADKLEKVCLIEDVKVIVWKVDSTANEMIDFLQNRNYKYIEMSIVPFIDPLTANLDDISDEALESVRIANKNDFGKLKEIARTSFRNDRFHKDPNFNNVDADRRYVYWLENSINDGDQIYAIFSDKEPAGFFTIKIDERHKSAELGIECISPRFQGRRLGTIMNMVNLYNLKERGFIHFETQISVSNLSIFNLYVSLGFKFKNQKICFHKWL